LKHILFYRSNPHNKANKCAHKYMYVSKSRWQYYAKRKTIFRSKWWNLFHFI